MFGFISAWVSRLATALVTLVQVPVFLHFWSVALYGEWMIVTAVPSYLNVSSMGFGDVAGNEMTMMAARGDREGALRAFQSCWWLITAICSVCIFLLGIVLYLFPVSETLKLQHMGPTDSKWIVFYLGCSVLLSQLETLLQSAYRCVGRYPYGAFVKSCVSLGAFGAMLVPVCLGRGARTTALVYALANVAGTIVLYIMVRRDIPWIEFGWSYARLSEIRRLVSPAVAFMAFPVGNSFNLQGTLLAVGYALGPVAVVVFGTARTVSRVALQLVQMINQVFMPEMSIAFGTRDIALIRALHRRAFQMALTMAVAVIVAMMSFGPWFLHHWTRGHVPPSRPLLLVLLVIVAFNTMWTTSSALVASINKHQKLAAWYLVATSFTVVLSYLLARRFGLYGVAVSLVVSELIMNLYVLPEALRLSHDTLPAFLAGLLHYPSSLRPAALAARLRRSRSEVGV
jgi:O-antigen/teichoic acid export membrane protein